jgi:hypothetical protein
MRFILSLCFVFGCVGCSLFPIETASLNNPNTPSIPKSDPAPQDLYGFDAAVIASRIPVDAALKLAALCDEYSLQIEYDGTRKEPVLKTTADIGLRFKTLNEFAWKGPNKLMPDSLKRSTGKIVQAELEPIGKAQPLSPELRSKAASLFSALGYCFRQVKQHE